jgi:hypothetical protein
MTVEHLMPGGVESDEEVTRIQICTEHEFELRAMLIQRGVQDRQPDLYEAIQNTMIMGVMSFMGPTVFPQHDGCPVCVLEGTLERAVDEMVATIRKSN